MQAACGKGKPILQQEDSDKNGTQKISEGKTPSLASTEVLGDLIRSKKGKKNTKANNHEDEVVTRAAERTAAAVGE